MKYGVDSLTELHHALGIFDRASEDLEVRVFELERRVADDSANGIALIEKALNQVASKKTGGPGDQTGPEVIEWFCG
jgi:hypothetical protein